MHIGPIFVGGTSIGKNCSLHIGTMIVGGQGTKYAPSTIGDNVTVGVGAVILGGVKIANYVAIGANAVVNRDVTEENVAVAGVPAKIISRHGTKFWGANAKRVEQ